LKNITGLILTVYCSAVLTFLKIQLADAAEFSCASGDVTCLIAAINEANAVSGEHTIHLEPGSYTLKPILGTPHPELGFRQSPAPSGFRDRPKNLPL
jgi:hypothetical protein